MQSNIKIPCGWYGTRLPKKFRACKGTYELYKSNVPHILPSKYTGLHFLEADIGNIEEEDENTVALNAMKENFPEISESFIRFMSSSTFLFSIPSYTACYFNLGTPQQIPLLESSIVLFYRDQQDCCAWYLVLDGKYAGSVIVSRLILGATNPNHNDHPETLKTFDQSSAICADSFEEFIYRLWVENGWNMNEGLKGQLLEACNWYENEYAQLAINTNGTS